MQTWRWDIRCSSCGRFISHKDENAMSMTPFGTYTDLEPPDEEFICGKCWINADEGMKRLQYATSWLGPSKAFPSEEEIERIAKNER